MCVCVCVCVCKKDFALNIDMSKNYQTKSNYVQTND